LRGFLLSRKVIMIKNAFIIYIILINLIAYIIMCFDKYQSKKKGSRIPENSLFFIALLLGALGIYLGMKTPIHHKAAKASFKLGIPLLIILNVVCIYICSRLRSN
jgi:uncharacterized membrane protein YsdA (DUF1294 family)